MAQNHISVEAPKSKFPARNLILIIILLVLTAGLGGYFLGFQTKNLTQSKSSTTNSNISHTTQTTPTPITTDVSRYYSLIKRSGAERIYYDIPEGWSQNIGYDTIANISDPNSHVLLPAQIMLSSRKTIHYGNEGSSGKIDVSPFLFVEIKNIQDVSVAQYKKKMLEFVDPPDIKDVMIAGKNAFSYYFRSPGEHTSYAVENGKSGVWDLHVSMIDGISPNDRNEYEKEGKIAEKQLQELLDSINYNY